MNKNKLATRLAALLAIALLTTACAPSRPPNSSVRAGKPAKYTPPPPPSEYGEWYIESRTCTIRARATDFTLQTDGRPENGLLTLKALFVSPLASPPVAEVSEILVPVPVEGTRRGYSILLAYDAANAAHMFKQDTFLMVRYQPLTSPDVMESSFQTTGLMHALANLAKHCD